MQSIATQSAARFLTFRIDDSVYALRTAEVSEVIHVPRIARVPQSPAPLLGLANLRGTVLPLVSLRTLLNKPVVSMPTERAIVLDGESRVAIVVDSVATLASTNAEQIETGRSELSADTGEKLHGVFSVGNDQAVVKILDIRALLDAAFVSRAKTSRKLQTLIGQANSTASTDVAKRTEMLVTFEIESQEFALPITVVQEIIPAPKTLTEVAGTENVVRGVISVRDSLLPVLSLRSLLGFSEAATPSGEKIVVLKVAGARVGLVTDRARSIFAADADLVEQMPAVLAARIGGESRIKSIYRGDQGRRLISILSPEHLFREDVMQTLSANARAQKSQTEVRSTSKRSELIFLVFRLGDEEFGLPIDAVVEVAHVPTQITRIPKAPKFLEGVVNLRGEVLPVVDQRRRFEMSALEHRANRKLIVVKTERHRAALIVDSVSDVLRISSDAVEPPPDLTEEISRLVRGVINLERSSRMVLLLDPTELLTRAELALLDKFAATSNKADA